MADATDRENSDLADAIMRSKSDTPLRLHENSVVVLRLTRHAQAAEVAHEILQSPDLEKCRAMVLEAGCELRPEWAGGAWLLLPLTREQFEEAGLETTPVHIIALSRDEDALRRALKAVPKEKRPKLKTVRAWRAKLAVGWAKSIGRRKSGSLGLPAELEAAAIASKLL
ncbi:unnamed protein product, partial [Polarella glacialis]